MHNRIASQYAPGDDLPCADVSLLAPLKRSPEYRAIRPRVASPRAIDSWQDEGVHFFIFQLHPGEGAAAMPDDPPVAVFAMHPEEPAPVSAVVVTPKPGGEEAEVLNLRQPESAYTAAYSSSGTPAQAGAGEAAPGAIAEHGGDAEPVNGATADGELAMLNAVRGSAEFRAIEGRLASLSPSDSWHEEGARFFVFELLPADSAHQNGHEPSVAVFAMRPLELAPISAVIVRPGACGDEAEVVDLREPGLPGANGG